MKLTPNRFLKDLADHGRHRVIYYPETGSGFQSLIATTVDLETAIVIASAIAKVDQILVENFGEARSPSIQIDEYVSGHVDKVSQKFYEGFWLTCDSFYINQLINELLCVEDTELPPRQEAAIAS